MQLQQETEVSQENSGKIYGACNSVELFKCYFQ